MSFARCACANLPGELRQGCSYSNPALDIVGWAMSVDQALEGTPWFRTMTGSMQLVGLQQCQMVEQLMPGMCRYAMRMSAEILPSVKPLLTCG